MGMAGSHQSEQKGILSEMKIIKRSGMEDTFDIKKIEASSRRANNSVIDY